MLDLFEPGAAKTFSRTVVNTDTASFANGQVHPVYATFALGRDAEWVCRLFVIDMKEEGEEGIGTFLNITHRSPAMLGQQVDFTAILKSVNGNEVICSFVARVGNRVIAEGETGQKILKKEKLDRIFNELAS